MKQRPGKKKKKKTERKQVQKPKIKEVTTPSLGPFYLKSILFGLFTLIAAWYILVYNYHDEKLITAILDKAKVENGISSKDKKLVDSYGEYSTSLNYKLFHAYKWVTQVNLLENYNTIQRFRKDNVSQAQFQEFKSGFDYSYVRQIKERTPEDAIILMPDTEDLDTVVAPNFILKNVSNKAWSYYFLHPRTLVYDTPNLSESNPDFLKDSNYEKNRRNITNVATANGRGYQHLNYLIETNPKFGVFPVDPADKRRGSKENKKTNYILLFISLLITFFLGLCLLLNISLSFSYLEKLGLSFLLGIGVQVFGMILLDFVGIPISVYSIYAYSILLMAGFGFRIYKMNNVPVSSILMPYHPYKNKAWNKINFSWTVLFGILIYLLYLLATKTLYFPPFEFDSIAGYDLMAKVLASEGTFNNSLFSSNGYAMSNTAHRLIYPPLVSGSFAYMYMSGALTSKLMSMLIYGCMLISLYGLFRRINLTHLNAMITLFLILLIPELISHASLSQTNMPQGVYTSIAVILFYVWYREKERNSHFLYLSMVFFACNSMVRTENALFAFIIGVILLVYTLRNRNPMNIKRTLMFAFCSLFPLLLWMLFLNINDMKPYVPVDPGFDFSFSSEKFNRFWILVWGDGDQQKSVLLHDGFFGFTPYLYFYTLIISTIGLPIYYYLKRSTIHLPNFKKMVRDHTILVVITLSFICLYTLFFYFIDYNWDSMRNVVFYSYKRGLFATMILFCFFIGSNFLTRGVFNRIDGWLAG